MKQPVTYYGGKQRLSHIILPRIPNHTNYTECFFGGGTIFFLKGKALVETINDINDIVITFYEVLQRNFKRLNNLIDSSLISRVHYNEAYIILSNPHKYSKIKIAWAFWYASNFSWGNKIGGGLKWSNDINTRTPDLLASKKTAFTEQLKFRIENTFIESRDALEVITSRDTVNTFHFIDPPYFNADQGHYKGYTKNDFIDLLDLLPELKGKWMLTNYPSDILSEFISKTDSNVIYKQFNNHGMRKDNRPKIESIVFNYPEKQLNLAL